MEENQFSRMERIMGQEPLKKISEARVAVFGVGGVGGYVVEALARCGIGTLDIVDNDVVVLSNINRQIIATHDTLGRSKVDVAEERIHAICPDIIVNKYEMFYLPETRDQFDFTQYDYVVDAIDTVTAKLDIIETCTKAGVPIISSMGAGNRMDPTKLQVCDIYETKADPLAKIMRQQLKKRGIRKLKVVSSTELPIKALEVTSEFGRHSPGSTAFVPSAAGLIIASAVIADLTGFDAIHRTFPQE